MTLPPHSFLGPYEILAPLGAGGMGEVFRALDPRLGREVAIKVLLPDFAADGERLKRFEQEARAVALLNHPNILHVYDTGLFEGMPYLVMELLEGETLRDRMGGQPLPLRKALEIAIQIARGLAVAHDKGIIHRDLKPENIFVLPDGRVKILDFGLAKLLAAPSGETRTQAFSVRSQLTKVGAVVGTAGYMSPEQVNGWTVDARSDLFSFGIIFWEMVSGRPPFHGNSVVETLHAILKDEPAEFPPQLSLPAALDRTLRRCLEKHPKARFQSAQDLVFSLESSSVTGLAPLSGTLLRRVPRKFLARGLKVLAIGLGLAALAAGAWALGRRSGGPEPMAFHRLTYRNGTLRSARFAADGQTFVYAMSEDDRPSQLMVGRLDSIGANRLALPPNSNVLSISKSDNLALLLKTGAGPLGTLAVAPLNGGAPREILEQVRAADWSPDGRELAVVRLNENGNYCLEYPIGNRLLEAPGATILESPRVSPKGDTVAFLEFNGIGKAALVTIDKQLRRRVLVRGECTTLQWAPDGQRIFFTFRHAEDRQDLRSVTRSGRQRVLDTVMGRVRIHDVSRSGRLLVEHFIYKTSMFFQGPGDAVPRDLSWLQSSVAADLSADGKQILFAEMREGAGPGGAHLRGPEGDAKRLGDGDPLALSRDGKWALVSPPDAPMEVSLLPTGAGSPRRIKGLRADWGVFLPGGREVLVGGIGPAGKYQIFTVTMATGELKPWPGPARPEAFCTLSPDGTRLALGPLAGKLQLYSLDGRELQTVAGLEEGEWVLQWNAEGTAVYVADPAHLPTKVYLFDVTTGTRTLWRELAPPDRTGVENLRSLAVTPDGRSVVFSFVRTLASDLYVTDPLP